MSVRWYHVLIGNSAISLEDDKIVIQRVLNGKRTYAQFDSCGELYTYLAELPQSKRCAFEVIKGLRPHRLYFDIDADLGFRAEKFFPAFFAACAKLLADLGHTDTMRNWAIYSSCGPDKISYHIVARAWSVSHHHEARAFYEELRRYLEGEHYASLDRAIYASTQHFRLYGTSKEGANRYKHLVVNTTTYEVDTVFTAQWLEDSLVQQITGTTRLSFPEALKCKTEYLTSDEIVTPDQIIEIYDMVNDATRANTTRGPAFRLLTAKGTMLTYKNLRPYECPTCQRIHHNENPFVTIDDRTGEVSFCCRRDSASTSIGRVDLYIDELRKYFMADSAEVEVESVDSSVAPPRPTIKPVTATTLIPAVKPPTAAVTRRVTIVKPVATLIPAVKPPAAVVTRNVAIVTPTAATRIPAIKLAVSRKCV